MELIFKAKPKIQDSGFKIQNSFIASHQTYKNIQQRHISINYKYQYKYSNKLSWEQRELEILWDLWAPCLFQKIQYGHQAAILKVTSLKINRLLLIYISFVPLKFGVDIQSYLAAILNLTLLKINRPLHTYISIVPLKFGVDFQSQTKVRVWKPKNPIWPPGGHFESDVAENL